MELQKIMYVTKLAATILKVFEEKCSYRFPKLPGGMGDIGEGGLSSSASSLAFMSSTYFDRKA